jgi:hypothetical protein
LGLAAGESRLEVHDPSGGLFHSNEPSVLIVFGRTISTRTAGLIVHPMPKASNILDTLSMEISRKFDTFFSFSCKLSDNEGMEGMTVSELAKALKISVDATRKRIETAGIQPITREAVYDPQVLEILRNVRMGRPPKKKE